jgi:glycosyltransferase involved in cell wall biosynthesis
VRILVVHQHYLFPGQPGGSRFNEMARLWAAAGHDVTVVAGARNYATNEVPPGYRNRWVVRERDGHVSVWRCHVPSSYNRGYLGRMWAFVGFTASATTAVLLAPRPDVIVGTSPPLVVVVPAWVASRCRIRRVPWIFEVRDLWPESAVTTGVLKPRGLLTRFLYWLERGACASADRINVLTPAFRDDLVRRRLSSPDKITLIPNGADLSTFQPGTRDNDARREFGWGSRTVVLYAGALGRANGIGQLVATADRLRSRNDILIAVAGDGPERKRWQDEAGRQGLSNIQFLGPQPKETMPELVNACDVGAAVLQKNSTFTTVYPNKVFDYMACARPVLLAVDGVARALVCEDAHAGLYAEPENADDLAKVIQRLADDSPLRKELGENGRAWVCANASREALTERYLRVLQQLVA